MISTIHRLRLAVLLACLALPGCATMSAQQRQPQVLKLHETEIDFAADVRTALPLGTPRVDCEKFLTSEGFVRGTNETTLQVWTYQEAHGVSVSRSWIVRCFYDADQRLERAEASVAATGP